MGTPRKPILSEKRKFFYTRKLFHEPYFPRDYKLPDHMVPPMAFNFDQVGLPGGLSCIGPQDADISVKIGSYELAIPFISSPMVCVTDAKMAIEMAHWGGLGVVYHTGNLEKQLEMVKKVKKAEVYIIRDVTTISPEDTIKTAVDLMETNKINGLPVTEDGTKCGTLLGIITNRDVMYISKDDYKGIYVKDRMSPRPGKNFIFAYEDENIEPEEAIKRLSDHRIEKLPIQDRKTGKLTGLITAKDIRSRREYPKATRKKDDNTLVCAAAIGVDDLDYALKLQKYVDIFVIDASHAWSNYYINKAKEMIKNVNAEFILGNIAEYGAAEDFLTKIDYDNLVGIRTGKGSGSTCTTNLAVGQGTTLLNATTLVAEAVNDYGAYNQVKVISDGGIWYGADIQDCFVAGANAVMFGRLIAQCEESPAPIKEIKNEEGNVIDRKKMYFGEGSNIARELRDTGRYSSKMHSEGEVVYLTIKPMDEVMTQKISEVKSAISALGCKSIREVNLDTKPFIYQGRQGFIERRGG